MTAHPIEVRAYPRCLSYAMHVDMRFHLTMLDCIACVTAEFSQVGTRGTAQSKEWYKDHGIEIILNTRIASVDVSARSVVTSDGDRIQYKHLVIATGCTSIKIPPEVGGDLPGVHYIRSYKSIMALYQDLKVCENAVIVGGGQYALEAAVSIAAWGVNVDVVVKEPNIMHDVWPATLASIFEDDFRYSKNVAI